MSTWRSIGLLPESSAEGRYPDDSFDMPSCRDHLRRYRAYFSDGTVLDIEAHDLSEAWGIAHDRAYLDNKLVMTVEKE